MHLHATDRWNLTSLVLFLTAALFHFLTEIPDILFLLHYICFLDFVHEKLFFFFFHWLQPTFSAEPRMENGFFWGNKLKPRNSGWIYNNCSNHRIQNGGYAATKDIINLMMLVKALCLSAHSLCRTPISLFLGICSKLNKASAPDDVSTLEGNL